MHLPSLWLIFAALAVRVFADVSISQPAAGLAFSGSGGPVSITVGWIDSSSDDTSVTSLSKVKLYAITLCTGDNNNIKSVLLLSTSVPSTATSYAATIALTAVPNGIYFFQVYAQFEVGSTIHYTPRFTLSGMSGSPTTYTYAASLFSVTGANPDAQFALTTGEATSIDSRSFTVPYTMQTGRTRYAPMQTQPGSVVTYTMYSNRHATSAYTAYTSILPSPNVYSTITPGWSYAVTSKFNTAPVAEYPTYFYPASSRVVAASMSTANKKRWI